MYVMQKIEHSIENLLKMDTNKKIPRPQIHLAMLCDKSISLFENKKMKKHNLQGIVSLWLISHVGIRP